MNRKTGYNIAIGLLLAIATIILHSVFGKQKGLELSSFLMIIIGAVYVGFALLSHHKFARNIELLVATLFVLMGIFGLWFSPWIIILGLFLHGLWDLAHHNKTTYLVKIPKWYIPFCATYDIVMAIYLTIIMIV